MNSAILRTLIVYGIVLPLAVLVGWMLSSPMQSQSVAVIGAVIFVLMLPLILKYHYAALVFSANALMTVAFLPGTPPFWVLMTVLNIGMALGYRILQRRPLFIHVPSLTFAALAFGAVVAVTAAIRGGIGVRVLGAGSYGGKPAYFLMVGVLTYFAFASMPVATASFKRYSGLFFLSAMTAVLSHLIYPFPSLWFLYSVFPPSIATSQVVAEYTGTAVRWGGLAIACGGLVQYTLLRTSLSDMLSGKKLWQGAAFILLLGGGLLGGYRSTFVMASLLVAILFFLEGLHRTKWLFIAVLVGLLAVGGLMVTAKKLPMTVQRSLSVLPFVEVDNAARADAQASSDWRVRMWATLVPDFPKYIWIGKGYVINPTDLFLTTEAVRRGLLPEFSAFITVGEYHNGPLSVFIPLGGPGALAYVILMAAIGRALYKNYKYGSAELRQINRFFFAFFLAKLVFFLFVFGALPHELFIYTGLAGLSVAMNRGVCSRPKMVPKPVAPLATRDPLGLAPGTA